MLEADGSELAKKKFDISSKCTSRFLLGFEKFVLLFCWGCLYLNSWTDFEITFCGVHIHEFKYLDCVEQIIY